MNRGGQIHTGTQPRTKATCDDQPAKRTSATFWMWSSTYFLANLSSAQVRSRPSGPCSSSDSSLATRALITSPLMFARLCGGFKLVSPTTETKRWSKGQQKPRRAHRCTNSPAPAAQLAPASYPVFLAGNQLGSPAKTVVIAAETHGHTCIHNV